jgi:hypothetical protein
MFLHMHIRSAVIEHSDYLGLMTLPPQEMSAPYTRYRRLNREESNRFFIQKPMAFQEPCPPQIDTTPFPLTAKSVPKNKQHGHRIFSARTTWLTRVQCRLQPGTFRYHYFKPMCGARTPASSISLPCPVRQSGANATATLFHSNTLSLFSTAGISHTDFNVRDSRVHMTRY